MSGFHFLVLISFKVLLPAFVPQVFFKFSTIVTNLLNSALYFVFAAVEFFREQAHVEFLAFATSATIIT